jgi:hypothetical protein
MQNILKPRYRHHRIADDRTPVPLDDLTMRAWQTAGRALNGDETTAQASFDEIVATVSGLDRFSAPQQESVERELCRVKAEAEARLAEAEQNAETIASNRIGSGKRLRSPK